MTDYGQLGRALGLLRRMRGLTAEGFARRLHCEVRTVLEIESGIRMIGEGFFDRICGVLGVPSDRLGRYAKHPECVTAEDLIDLVTMPEDPEDINRNPRKYYVLWVGGLVIQDCRKYWTLDEAESMAKSWKVLNSEREVLIFELTEEVIQKNGNFEIHKAME